MYGLRALVAALVAERALEGYLQTFPQANLIGRTFRY